jgi:short-subunit dehydrogenase
MSTWLVTGASRGLGIHITRRLIAKGYRVIACGRNRERLESLAAGYSSDRFVPLSLDLSDAVTIKQNIITALDPFERLDGVINNAGFAYYKPFVEHSESELLDLIQVNLMAAIQVSYAVLPRMVRQGRGHIVNIGSDLGRRPMANMAVYAAAKHGLTGFSHSLLREVKSLGIKVSLINPGIVDTDFGGVAQGSRDPSWSLKPDDLARLITQVIEQPGNTLVDELSVHPLGQDF